MTSSSLEFWVRVFLVVVLVLEIGIVCWVLLFGSLGSWTQVFGR